MRPASMSDRMMARSQCRTSEAIQAIELAAGHQHILAAERPDDPLADATAFALVLDEVQVGAAPRCLLTDKHRLVVHNIEATIKENSQIY
jgi:hypothetical protein